MTSRAPLHNFRFWRGRLAARLRRDRLAEGPGESEGPDEKEGRAEHRARASDPIRWESGRLERWGGVWYYVAAGDIGPGRRIGRLTWHS